MRKEINKIEKRYGIKISLDIVEPVANVGPLENVERILRANSDYDFVILHLGSKYIRDAYEIADRSRELSHAVLVAESSFKGHGEAEVLQHFDEYIGVVSKDGNLIRILEKYSFIPHQD